MGYQPDQDYTGTITAAAVVESQSGNSGFELRLLNPEHGQIKHTIWVTEKSADMAKRQLKACGLTEEQMGSDLLWNDPAALLAGREVSWHCKEQADRNGELWTRVAWINSSKAASPEAKLKSRGLLAAAKSEEEQPAPKKNAHGAVIDDLDVPF